VLFLNYPIQAFHTFSPLVTKAYYGEVSGKIIINGQEISSKEISDSIGFVPQDDIVFAELTVKENLVFSGKFRLPVGTSLSDIESTAMETLVYLGLVRVADSIVGDVSHRGISGGERKRVNIGIELMGKPSILFLDEPTSGLDSSSAMLVMKSLREIVERQGMTVCSVIHQPRAFIYELFDTVILMGDGGRCVYQGPSRDAHSYFTNLGYQLPMGENIADWIVDISSGHLLRNSPEDLAMGRRTSITSSRKLDPLKLAGDLDQTREFLFNSWISYFNNLNVVDRQPPEPFPILRKRERPRLFRQILLHIHRIFLSK
jgi:ABC-type multidrug transport system ATPase subunit